MKILITFSDANAAFDDYEREVKKMFSRAARIVTDSNFEAEAGCSYPLMDTNGNTVGNVLILEK